MLTLGYIELPNWPSYYCLQSGDKSLSDFAGVALKLCLNESYS